MSSEKPNKLLVFSGNNEDEITQMVEEVVSDNAKAFEEMCLCHNLGVVRKKYYRSIVCENLDDLEKKYTEEKNIPFVLRKLTGKVVFLFPGNGTYQRNMLSILSDSHHVLKETIDEYASCYKRLTGNDLLTELQDTYITQQIQIVVSEIAIVAFWIACGIEPDVMIGHSLGEYAVAAIANVMCPEDIIKMLLARGEILVERMRGYVMVSAQASREKFFPGLDGLAEIAAYNCKDLVTLLVKEEDIQKVDEWLRNKEISHNRLMIAGGGHCSLLRDELERFKTMVSDVKFSKPNRNIISTVEEGEVSMDTLDYWGNHLVNPVKFQQAMEKLQGQDIGIMVDVGVTPILLNMAMQNYRDLSVNWIPSIKKGRKYRKQLLQAAGMMYESGKDLKWEML